MSHESASSSYGGIRGSGRSQDSPRLTHMVYSSANSEHYQMYDCNVEMHEDWTKTLRVVDIIYPSGPALGVRIMYKNYLGGESCGTKLSFVTCPTLTTCSCIYTKTTLFS